MESILPNRQFFFWRSRVILGVLAGLLKANENDKNFDRKACLMSFYMHRLFYYSRKLCIVRLFSTQIFIQFLLKGNILQNIGNLFKNLSDPVKISRSRGIVLVVYDQKSILKSLDRVSCHFLH